MNSYLLSRRELLFRTIVEHLNCGVILLDTERVYFLNRAAISLFDLEGVDRATLRPGDFLDPRILAEERPLERILEQGEGTVHLRYQLGTLEVVLTFLRFPNTVKKLLLLVDFGAHLASEFRPTLLDGEHLEVVTFFGTVLDNLRELSWAKNIPVRMAADQKVVGIYGNRPELEYIFTNMAGKLIKFSHRGEVVVSVTERESGEAHQISLENAACTIAEDDYTRLTSRFDQEADKAKKLIEKHGGRFWVDFEPGLSFHFTLPKDMK